MPDPLDQSGVGHLELSPHRKSSDSASCGLRFHAPISSGQSVGRSGKRSASRVKFASVVAPMPAVQTGQEARSDVHVAPSGERVDDDATASSKLSSAGWTLTLCRS